MKGSSWLRFYPSVKFWYCFIQNNMVSHFILQSRSCVREKIHISHEFSFPLIFLFTLLKAETLYIYIYIYIFAKWVITNSNGRDSLDPVHLFQFQGKMVSLQYVFQHFSVVDSTAAVFCWDHSLAKSFCC